MHGAELKSWSAPSLVCPSKGRECAKGMHENCRQLQLSDHMQLQAEVFEHGVGRIAVRRYVSLHLWTAGPNCDTLNTMFG